MERKAMRIRPPAEAKAFVISRVAVGRTPNGKHGGYRTRMKGPPQADGSVPDIWPAAEFSPQMVLSMWGPGHYKVDWYDAQDNLMKGEGTIFDVDHPHERARHDRRLRPAKRETEIDTEASPATGSAAAGGIGFLEILTLLRGEREEADRRAEAAKERDREFYAAQQSQQTQLLTVLLGNRSASVDPSLLGQQMQLAIQQGMLGIQRQLFREQQQEADADPEPDPSDPPKDLEEAGSRIGLAFFSEIERNAPHLLRELVPTVVEWLKPRGFQPSASLQQQIASTLRARNGAGHADSD